MSINQDAINNICTGSEMLFSNYYALRVDYMPKLAYVTRIFAWLYLCALRLFSQIGLSYTLANSRTPLHI